MRQQGEAPGAAPVTWGATFATGASRRPRAPDPHIEPTPPPDAAEGGAMERLCVARGLKMTEQRRVIARVLSEASDHPDVEELYRRAGACKVVGC